MGLSVSGSIVPGLEGGEGEGSDGCEPSSPPAETDLGGSTLLSVAQPTSTRGARTVEGGRGRVREGRVT